MSAPLARADMIAALDAAAAKGVFVVELPDANFDGVDLSGLDLRGVQAPRATFVGADFTGANMAASVMIGADFTGATFTDTILDCGQFPNAIFTEAIFTGASLMGARLRNSQFIDTEFTRVDLTGAIMAQVDLTAATFIASTLVDTELVNANLTGVRFIHTVISEVKMLCAISGTGPTVLLYPTPAGWMVSHEDADVDENTDVTIDTYEALPPEHDRHARVTRLLRVALFREHIRGHNNLINNLAQRWT